jgi:hypothetical protein
MRAGSHSTSLTAVKARAAATSMAAEEESPAPMGTFPPTVPSHPATRRPASPRAQATPFRYSPHFGPPRSGRRAEKRMGPSKSNDNAETVSSGDGRRAIHTAHGIAIGRTKPSL